LVLVLILVLLCLLFLQPANSHGTAGTQPIGITERINQTIPASLTFFDEQDRPIHMGDMITRPTIMMLVYYRCSRFCPQLLAGLAQALPHVPLQAARDYQVITISFNPLDTPALARDLKRNYCMAVNSPFPAAGWRFMTGDRKNIEQLCTAVGFRFRKEHDGFAHPVALIILSPERRISNYIHCSKFSYGVEYPIIFSPTGLSQALTDAAQGRLGASSGEDFLLCFGSAQRPSSAWEFSSSTSPRAAEKSRREEVDERCQPPPEKKGGF
jgi:protein SCO1/2